jgi:hypothetical protein
MKPSDVLQVARDQLADSGQNFWTDNELYRYMGMALNTLVSKWPELGHEHATIDATAYRGYYEVPSSTDTTAFLSFKNVGWVGPDKSIEAAENMGTTWKLKRIDARNQYATQWDSTVTGKPQYWRDTIEPNKFAIYPTPDTTGKIFVEYFHQYDKFDSSSTFNTHVSPYSHMLVDYVLYRAFLKDQEMAGQATVYKGLWDEHIQEVEESLFKASNSDRIVTVKDEDIYPFTDLGAM